MDYCKYVNIFHGCGEIDLPKPEGIAAKWFFIKAGCGNTNPAACLPFGAMSVSPYSGGYPTGYGDHCPNSHSRPAKTGYGKKLSGFAHIQQSGTGAIGYYYNYALTSPVYADSPSKRDPGNETARPGYYSCVLEDILCELTASKHTAFHRYTFGKDGGKVVIDLSNNGLDIPGHEKDKVFELVLTKCEHNTVTASSVIEGINVYFAVRGNTAAEIDGTKVIFEAGESRTAQIRAAISLRSADKALRYLSEGDDFDLAAKIAYEKWNKELSKVTINTESEEIKEIFYSNLYHSFIKPSDWSGESFIFDGDGAFLTDFATLWDMYKTALPLILMVNKEIGEKTVETLLSVGEELHQLPNCIGLTDRYKEFTEQARTLGSYVLMTAYRYGLKISPERMLKVIEEDIYAPNKKDFTVEGKCQSHTWMLDMADCCALAAQIADENGINAEKLSAHSGKWISCFDPETGLLSDDSSYYEGTKYNYSFRQMVDMDKRMEIAGGKEKFVELLDRFFGYGAEDTVQPTDPHNYAPVEEGIKLGRFEGFNNESDTEAPFSYIYAGRQDRTCEIIRAGMKYMFTTGRGGLPGNNDSGALSSYYVLSALGLFPVAGQDLFLIGSPAADGGRMELFNGNILEIKVENNSDENIYVKAVSFNGRKVKDFMLPASELMKGGILEFRMDKNA